jgi:hypothetical protein
MAATYQTGGIHVNILIKFFMDMVFINTVLLLLTVVAIGFLISVALFTLYLLLKYAKPPAETPKVFISANSTPTTTSSQPVLAPSRQPILEEKPVAARPVPSYITPADYTPKELPKAQCGNCQAMIFGEPVRAMVDKGGQKLVYKCPECGKEVAVSS